MLVEKMGKREDALRKEIWVPILGYEKSYEASSFGRIRSLDRYVSFRKKYKMKVRGVILKQQKHPKTGYLYLILYKDGPKLFLVHRIIASAFICACPKGHQVNHIDMNKENNLYTNLEWVTPKQNMDHMRKNVKIRYRVGEDRKEAKVTNDDVLVIRSMYYNRGITQQEIADIFNISLVGCHRIIRRKRWKHVE